MTRRRTFAKERAKQFSGKRNAGGIKVLTQEDSRPTRVHEVQNLGLVQTLLPNPYLVRKVHVEKKSSNLESYGMYRGGNAFDSGQNDIIDLGKLEMRLAKIAVCTK